MMSLKEKRAKFMKLFCSHLDRIDPSKRNSKIYTEFFSKMSDKEFDAYLKDFFSNEDNFFYLEIEEFENDLKMDNIEDCAKALNLPLYETVADPHINMDLEDAVVTPHPVPVGPIHMKQLVQMLLEKNNVAMKIGKRSAKAGTVTGEDKGSRISDVESYSLIAWGADKTMKELLGPRADNKESKDQMYADITDKGHVYLEDLSSTQSDKVAINTLDTYFKMQMLDTNLVYGGDLISNQDVDIERV